MTNRRFFRKMFLQRLLLIAVPWCLQAATPPVIDTNRKCFINPPGSADRKAVTLKLGVRNRPSHQLVSAVMEILVKEYMGYNLIAYDLKDKDPKAWGEEVSSGVYDIDMESLEVSGAKYTKYVKNDKTVVDAGSPGYSFRKGLYVTKGMVTKDAMAKWYQFYSDSDVKASSAVLFGADGLKAAVAGAGAKWPVCDSAMYPFCGTGALEGYWAPAVCQASPSACAVAFMATPGEKEDTARFEQLTSNHKMKLIHAYAGSAFTAKVKSLAGAGKQTLFVSDQADPLVSELKAVRIGFPDWFPGCDTATTKVPSGSITCDYGDKSLVKFMHSSLQTKAAEAFYVIKKVQVFIKDMQTMIGNLKVAGGSKTPHEAACAWMTANSARVKNWVPQCISNPPVVPKTGDKVFDAFSMACKTVIAYPDSPMPACYTSANRPGKVDRKKQQVKMCYQGWLSHSLVNSLTAIVMQDFMGYSVTKVDVSSSSSSKIFEDIDGGACHADMESWQANPLGKNYIEYINKKGTVLNPGSNGFNGRAATYITPGMKTENWKASFWDFYTDMTDLKTTTLIKWDEVGKAGFAPTMQAASGAKFPSCTEAWCVKDKTSKFYGYWVPPQCVNKPQDCVISVHLYSNYDTAYFETLTKSLGLKIIHAYYAGKLGDVVKEIVANGKNTLHYYWYPDPLVAQLGSKRISYPDYNVGCRVNYEQTKDPNVAELDCDFPGAPLQKVIAASMRDTMPEAYYVISNLAVTITEVEALIALHKDGGGSHKTHEEAACAWVKANEARVKTWAPDCVSSPKKPEDLKIGDAVFSQSLGTCLTIDCKPDQMVLAGGKCLTCAEGQLPSADRTSCVGCPQGTTPDKVSGKCVQCGKGSARGPSELGCASCKKGYYSDVTGATECKACKVGEYQPSSKNFPTVCTSCETVATGSSTQLIAAGISTDCKCPPGYITVSASCQACKKGMKCGKWGMQFPDVAPAHYVKLGDITKPAFDVQVYLCNPKEACGGGEWGKTVCRAPRSGFMCETCPPESSRNYDLEDPDSKGCDDCTNLDSVFIIIAPICLLIATMVIMYGSKKSPLDDPPWHIEVQGVAGQLMMFAQVMGAFLEAGVLFGEPMTGLTTSITNIVGPNIFAKAPCIMQELQSPLSLYALQVCGPAAFMVWLLLVFSVAQIIRRNFFSMDGLTNTLGEVLVEFYVSVTLAIFTPFKCYSHPNGGLSSLEIFPSVICDEGDHLIMKYGLAVFGVLAYPVSTVAVTAFGTWLLPRRLIQNDIGILVRGHFLFNRWRADKYWFSNVTVLRNFTIAVLPMVLDESQIDISVGLMVIVLVIALILTIWHKPRRTPTMNRLDCFISFVQIIVLGFGAMTVYGKALNSELSTLAVTLVLSVAVVGGLMVAFKLMQVATSSLGHDIFLSHHAGEGGASARLMHIMLVKLVKRKGGVFYDIDMLAFYAVVLDAVKQSKHMVNILGRETLLTTSCIGSIVVAWKRKVPIHNVSIETRRQKQHISSSNSATQEGIGKQSRNSIAKQFKSHAHFEVDASTLAPQGIDKAHIPAAMEYLLSVEPIQFNARDAGLSTKMLSELFETMPNVQTTMSSEEVTKEYFTERLGSDAPPLFIMSDHEDMDAVSTSRLFARVLGGTEGVVSWGDTKLKCFEDQNLHATEYANAALLGKAQVAIICLTGGSLKSVTQISRFALLQKSSPDLQSIPVVIGSTFSFPDEAYFESLGKGEGLFLGPDPTETIRLACGADISFSEMKTCLERVMTGFVTLIDVPRLPWPKLNTVLLDFMKRATLVVSGATVAKEAMQQGSTDCSTLAPVAPLEAAPKEDIVDVNGKGEVNRDKSQEQNGWQEYDL